MQPTIEPTMKKSAATALAVTVLLFLAARRQPPAMTTRNYSLLVVALISFSLGGGYMAATQPPKAGWRFFSWHPLLMTIGMVGLAGIGAVTKKLGGYTNTKVNQK